MRFTCRSLRLALFALVGSTSTLSAQVCPDPLSDNFWRNDIVDDVPTGVLGIAVIPFVCQGEAIGTLFTLPPGTPPQKIKSVAVPFAEQSGSAGSQALVNVEIYERRPGDAPYPNPGTKVFDLNQDANLDAQIATSGINVIDMTPYNVIVEYDFSVVFRMNFNVSYPGCPAAGAQANFFTDNNSCHPGVNYLDILGQGWLDPGTDTISGFPFPLCGLWYVGDWVIRACTEDTGTLASATVRNGAGVNPLWFSSLTLPQIGTTWISSIDIATIGASASFIASVASGPLSGVFLPASGELLIDLSGPLIGPIDAAFGAHAISIPNDVSLVGLAVYTHGATFSPGQITFTNAIDLVIGL